MDTYQDELAFARDLAVSAGDVLLRHFGAVGDVEMKGWADPVTGADRESEALIEEAIRQRYPGDGIDGEETGHRPGRSGRCWIVDPLDGTANFSAGLPIFSVVLTLINEAKPDSALMNVTYDPVRREMFWAVVRQGAYLNDTPIGPTSCLDLARALCHIHFDKTSPFWEASMDQARLITASAPHARSIGSTALAQAYVAAGRLDAHVKVRSGAYDVVGGNLLVKEAGGIATDFYGKPWALPGTLLAAGASLHPLLLKITSGIVTASG